MLAVGVDGKLYPCMRYCSYSLNHQDEYVIGHVNTGIDYDKVRPFEAATFKLQSDEECINCKIASGCSFARDLIMIMPILQLIFKELNIFVKCIKRELEPIIIIFKTV